MDVAEASFEVGVLRHDQPVPAEHGLLDSDRGVVTSDS